MRFWNKKVESDEARGASCSSRTSRRFLTRASRPTTRNPSRRGILLLVALSLLVLFLLVGTAFVVTARHSSRTAKTVGEANRTRSAEAGQADLLDNVLKQIVRDTNNPNSSLRYHSLLRDMYGNDGFTGVVPTLVSGDYVDELGNRLIDISPESVDSQDNYVMRWAPSRNSNGAPQNANVTNGQILELDITRVTDLFGNEALATNPQGMKQLRNAYNGMSLTFTSGPAKGVTTRIVGYLPAERNGVYDRDFARFRLVSFKLADGSTLPVNSADMNNLFLGSRFVVNGRPFNGTGVGYDPFAATGDARLSTQESGQPLALLPNTVYFDPGAVTLTGGNDPRFYFPNNVVNQDSPYFGIGGSDEGYDAADFQNMLMGLMPQVPGEIADPTSNNLIDVNNGNPLVLPSLHRPALLNFHNGGTSGTTLHFNPMLLRKVTLRPSWFDHPNFTGSNPELSAPSSLFANAFDQVIVQNGDDLSALQGNTTAQDGTRALVQHSIFGPWDVDNDNDGVRDSVWVDFGAPVMSMPDGTLVKPLAAVLCLDMDGRLNVNAHGSRTAASSRFRMGVDPTFYDTNLAGAASTKNLPFGQGYGPADISLDPVLGSDWSNRLMGGSNGIDATGMAPMTGVQFGGRYGSFNRDPMDLPGEPSQMDIGYQLDMQGVPQSYVPAPGTPKSQYGTAPDFGASYPSTGLNDFGQPVSEVSNDFAYQARDMPYEMDLFNVTGVNPSAADTPFTLNELERIIRAYDVDAAAAPDRLAVLGNFLDPARLQQTRNLVTTDSWDVSVPAGSLPSWVEDGGHDGDSGTNDKFSTVMGRPPVGASFADLIEYRFRAANGITAGTALTAVQRRAIEKLIPRDLANGTKLDINRALGNGRDDQFDPLNPDPTPRPRGWGIVDEPGELEGGQWQLTRDIDPSPAIDMQEVRPGTTPAHPSDAFASIPYRVARDLNNDGVIDPGLEQGIAADVVQQVFLQNLRRQELAKDLYITALATMEPVSAMTAEERAAVAKQVAQWAINTVDFRDADGAMTAFEYDINPFDGWAADGDLSTVNDIAGTDTRLNTADDVGAVVWGLERPELLMTETLAWHDRRTSDTATENPHPQGEEEADTQDPQNPDPDFDQVVRPRGGFLLEIYNPWAPNPAAPADLHAIENGEDQGVLLSQRAELNGVTSPVWRLAVQKRGGVPVDQTLAWNPDQPRTMPSTQMDRYAYFASKQASDVNVPDDDLNAAGDDQRAYHVAAGTQRTGLFANSAIVRPGRYMVVGSGEDEDGDGVYEAAFAEKRDEHRPANTPNPRRRRLELDTRPGQAHTVRMMDSVHNQGDAMEAFDDPRGNRTGMKLRSPGDSFLESTQAFNEPGSDPSVAAADILILANEDDPNDVRPFTVSEPAAGYPDVVGGVRWSTVDLEYVAAVQGQGFPHLDIPLDGPIRGGVVDVPQEYRDRGLFPFDRALSTLGKLNDNGTDPRVSYAYVYLQRLANPSLPWNPPAGEDGHVASRPVNPYRTVDSMSVNLNVYNSTAPNEEGESTNNIPETFASVERGYTDRIVKGGGQAYSLLTAEPPAGGNAANDPRFGRMTNVSQNYWRPLAESGSGNSFHMPYVPMHTMGYLNRAFDAGVGAEDERNTKPSQPFEWLSWNDRPYISGNELALVPRTDSFSLFRSFTTKPNTPGQWPYEEAFIRPESGFAHLVNMFYEHDDMPNGQRRKLPTGLYKVLDYVHVPSRFVGTEEWFNPASFWDDPANNMDDLTSLDDPRVGFQAPFNKVSQFREPGQVNLNTMASNAIYAGLMHGNTDFGVTGQVHPGPSWNLLVSSRHGTDNADILNLGSSPTFFANPIRTADAHDLVPLPGMMPLDKAVQSTMLRNNPNNPEAPLFVADTRLPHNDSQRSAHFYHQPFIRLDNLTTTRSNVYSIWTTVGFFEATPAPTLEQFADANGLDETLLATQALYDRVYPEGYQFGREYGLDTGDTRRLRGFSIVDRSIPVGFEPGLDHNTDAAIRLNRQIE